MRRDEGLYGTPHSTVVQSGMSVVLAMLPTLITGFRSTHAEKYEGNWPITAYKK